MRIPLHEKLILGCLSAGFLAVLVFGCWCEWSRKTADEKADSEMRAQIAAIKRDLSTVAIVASQGRCPCDSEGSDELEPGKMGRIIPDTKEGIARVLAILERFERILDDVEAGKAGAHIEGSFWNGKFDVTLRRTP